MTQSTIEKLYAIISILGEEKVEALYKLTGSEKISIAAARNLIKKEKLKNAISEKKSVNKLIKETGISRSVVYRALKK